MRILSIIVGIAAFVALGLAVNWWLPVGLFLWQWSNNLENAADRKDATDAIVSGMNGKKSKFMEKLEEAMNANMK